MKSSQLLSVDLDTYQLGRNEVEVAGFLGTQRPLIFDEGRRAWQGKSTCDAVTHAAATSMLCSMARGLDGPADVVESIGTAAGRIRRFFEAIEQGHSFGLGPGAHDEPWTLEFQRSAVSTYAETLSWEYMLGLSDAYEDCADLMVAIPAPDGHQLEWSRMQQYLRAAPKAIREAADGPIGGHHMKLASDLEPTAPPVVAFGKLATLVSATGAAALVSCGRNIETLCGQNDECPITEQEKEWLRRLRDGDRTIDIANDHGYSERSLYRALSEMWDRMDVDNRQEAIGLAMKNGWIT